MYHHKILVPKIIVFKPEYYKCKCGEKLEKHISCDGARFHVHSWSNLGIHCSAPMCEDNHKCGDKKMK